MAIWQDVRYAARLLRKNPGFTLITTATLALGIGANTAIFTVTDALLLRPLPFRNPDRLVHISTMDTKNSGATGCLSFPRFTMMDEQSRSFSALAAFTNETFNLTNQGEAEQLAAARVSWRFFDVLGVRLERGRGFVEEEDRPGGKSVVVISRALWKRRFGGQPGIIGRPITLDSKVYTVVGMTPEWFRFAFLGNTVDVWSTRVDALNLTTPQQITAGACYLNAVARLRPGVGIEQARAEMEVLNRQYRQNNPRAADADPNLAMQVSSLREQLVGNFRPALLILFGAVSLVLLIACANVASLLLARATGRRREFAVRTALGASRSSLLGQLLVESTFLALSGGALGIGVSVWAVSYLSRATGGNLPRIEEIAGIDLHILCFTVAVSLLTGVLFGLSPALQLSRADIQGMLREEGRGAIGGRGRGSLRNILVVGQVALSIVLLVGAGLLIRSFIRLETLRPGFEPRGILTMNLTLPPAKYGTPRQMIAFYEQLLAHVAVLPGVRAMAAASALPVNPTRFSPVLVEGQPAVPLAQRPVLVIQTFTHSYLDAMKIPLLRGRTFTEHDEIDSPPVVIVNQSFVRKFFPAEYPIGKHVLVGRRTAPAEIVGVIGDVRNVSLSAEPQAEILLPYAQLAWASMNLIIRAEGAPQSLINSVRREIAAVDPDQPVTAVQTMEDVLDAARAQPRLIMELLGIFSGSALVLAIVGLYGTISYSVSQRTQELGVRAALGASRADILALVIRQGAGLTLAGIATGVAAAFALTRLMATLVYEVSTTDAFAFVASPLLFLLCGLIASSVPAIRATRVDAAEALRHE